VFSAFRLAKVDIFNQLRKSFCPFLKKKVFNAFFLGQEGSFLIIFAP